MRFDELIEGLDGVRLRAETNPEIEHITFDSRNVRPGTLFVALVGSRHDAHRFIPQAVENGAVALVTDVRSQVPLPSGPPVSGLPSLVAPNSRETLAKLANRFHRRPFERLVSIAITGTNGKTTSAFLVESMFTQAGRHCALIGTIFFRLGQWEIRGQNTTPESLDLFALLSDYIDRGADSVVLEASSHGLEMNRLDEATFDVAAFTNLTPEHMDFHGDMERYYAAKRRLFVERLPASRQVGKPGIALVNLDDPYGRRLWTEIEEPRMGYGFCPEAQIRADQIASDWNGTRFTLHLGQGRRLQVELPLLGRHNVQNALVAAAIAEACGIDPEHIASGCARLTGVPGRLERVVRSDGAGPVVFVDFAHTPFALASALTALRQQNPSVLWIVFGCGGDRDQTKRAQMGRIAGELADVVVLTSDNPRYEDPRRILEAVEEGVQQSGKARLDHLEPRARGYAVQADRRQAIRWAITSASQDTAILVAGKGHETTQECQGRFQPFDDRQVAREILAEWHATEGDS